MHSGLERTLRILDEYPHRDVVIPVLGSALDESAASESALEMLLAAPEDRAPREILRRWHRLSPRLGDRARASAEPRLRHAAEQLASSDRIQTRENIANFAAATVAEAPDHLPEMLPLLMMLIDGPGSRAREIARRAVLDALLRAPRPLELAANDALFGALAILLRAYPQHQDRDVIRALFAAGVHGADLLARALEEGWPCRDDLLAIIAEEEAPAGELAPYVDALLRWLDSPFSAAREEARRQLRERTDESFLRCLAGRFTEGDAGAAPWETPIYRQVRWDLLPSAELAALPAADLERITALVQAAPVAAEERAARLARLLPVASGDLLRRLLIALRELPGEPILEALAPLLRHPDPEIQLLATELLPARGGRRAFALLVPQLSSIHEEVRVAAQRKVSGQSLPLLFDAYDVLDPADRRRALELLRRVDLHMVGQLRRALRSADDDEVVLALRVTADLDDIDPLEETLFDLTVSPSPRVRATLARTLARVEQEPGVHYLRLFLADPDRRVVANAVESLGELLGRGGAGVLQPFREHPDGRVRANALLALARGGDPEAREHLQALAEEGFPGVTASQDPAAAGALQRSARWAVRALEGAAP